MKLKSGFSLIELLVVVAIIGILAAIGSVGYNKYVASAGAGASTANAKQLADALTAEDTKFSICSGPTNSGETPGDTAFSCLTKIAGQFNINIADCNVNGAVAIAETGINNCKANDNEDYKNFPLQIGNNIKTFN
jgi:prepilin-type N-terminal cleavage/methylation domain-containing protein